MALEIGVVGLPNVGKSTLFNALTHAGATVAGYPFTTIEPNVGVVPVDDPRLDSIAALLAPEKVIPTTVRFVDIAGLVRGAHRGEGLGNQFLGHIRNVDAIAMVVRCFEAADVVHVTSELNPVADIQTVDTELVLADLATVERRLEKVRSAAKGHPRDYAAETAWLEGLQQHLDAGRLASSCTATAADPAWLAELSLLTAKPRLYVANVAEADLPHGGPLAARVAAHAAASGDPAVVVCAGTEMELLDLPAHEAAAYRAEMGIGHSSLHQMVRTGYELLGLITFFTTTGGKIVQAWTVPQGTHAPSAAARVHTDMERGFIRAEVVSWSDLMSSGSTAAAREAGRLRLEGREYVVADGDVIHFRFNV